MKIVYNITMAFILNKEFQPDLFEGTPLDLSKVWLNEKFTVLCYDPFLESFEFTDGEYIPIQDIDCCNTM